MADPLSIAASVVAIVTAAIQSVKLLQETVSRYKGRDKTLQRLQNELQDISNILDSLAQIAHLEASVSALLQGPVDGCSKICREFEQSMNAFGQKSKTGFRDWAKMEFRRGDINEFIDRISAYKATISVGIGAVTIRIAKVSEKALQEYNEMIQDTVYELNVRLQRIDEKLEPGPNTNPSSNANLDDEKEVTRLCLRICEDARHFLESLQRHPAISEEAQNAAEEEQDCFQAQRLTRQALNENQDSFLQIISQLRKRLETLLLSQNPNNEKERARLQEDINTSKQCLEICKMAEEASSKKEVTIGEAFAEEGSDQLLVTTLADLFDVKKAVSRGNSTQMIGSMKDETLQYVSEKRYGSRFGSVVLNPVSTMERNGNVLPPPKTRVTDQSVPRMDSARPSSNEMRKRMTQDEQK